MVALPDPIEPEIAPAEADPMDWVVGYRWAGHKFALQTHECERAEWFTTRWATSLADYLQFVTWPEQTIARIAGPLPAEGVDDMGAELCCPTCTHAAVCGGAPMKRSCRTCRHVIADGGWFCGIDGALLSVSDQRAACLSWASVA